VSAYPPTDRDISILVDKSVDVKSIYELMRECGSHHGEDLIEEVTLLDTYENEEKFGAGKVSHTFRIRYRSHERTLMNAEINEVQERLRLRVAGDFGAVLR
jgi:phenylalanyl-tRNA synthetase alpha chain